MSDARLRLRPDCVLVALPPTPNDRKVELIHTDLDTFLASKGIEEFQRVLPVPKVEQPGGIVVAVGKGTEEVFPGDRVLLEPEAGQVVEIDGWPHLIVREADITAVLEAA